MGGGGREEGDSEMRELGVRWLKVLREEWGVVLEDLEMRTLWEGREMGWRG